MTQPKPKGSHFLWWILGAATLLRIPLCLTPLTYASDTWRQADTASIAYHFYTGGFQLLYPQIFWGGAGPGFVETEFQLYPFLTALLYLPWGEQVWLGRVVSLLFSVGTLYVFYQWAQRAFDRNVATWGLLFFAISPLFLRYSVAYMPDATVLFFYTLTLYSFDRWLTEQTTRSWVITAAALTLALLVKPTSVHIGLILLTWAIAHRGWSVLRQRTLWYIAFASLVLPTLWYLHARSLFLTYGNTFGLFSGGDNKFGSLADWTSPRVYLSLFQLESAWVFAFGGVLLALFGFKRAWKECRFPLLSGWVVLLIYYLMLSRYTQQPWGLQYHIYALPFAALLVALGVEELRKSSRWKQAILASCTLATLGFAGNIYAQMLQTPEDPRKACADFVRNTLPPNAKVIISSSSEAIDFGVINNYQDPYLFYNSRRYGWSLPVDRLHTKYLLPMVRQGAHYIIFPHPEFLSRSTSLQKYLKKHTPIRVPNHVNCLIYKFKR